MSIHSHIIETELFLVALAYTHTRAGDPGYMEFKGIEYEHVYLLPFGELSIQEDGGRPYTIKGPTVFPMKPGALYRLEARVGVQNVLYCIHNKTTPGWDAGIEHPIAYLRAKRDHPEKWTASITVTP